MPGLDSGREKARAGQGGGGSAGKALGPWMDTEAVGCMEREAPELGITEALSTGLPADQTEPHISIPSIYDFISSVKKYLS